MPRLGTEAGLAAPLILAPAAEQKRIADKLDALLAKVDACRQRLDRVPALLNRFRQAVLAAATAGDLTAEWRSEETWQERNLGDLLIDVRYGTSQKSHYDLTNGIPVLRIPNIGDKGIDPTDLKYGVFDQKEIDTLSLISGDLLLIRSNGSVDLVGKTAVVEKSQEGFLYAGYLIRLRANTNLIAPKYLRIWLSSPKVRRHIQLTARSTSGVNNINSEEVKAISVSYPAKSEQTEIVRRVEALFALADKLEARYAAARKQVDALTPSLLAKAFRGELVPQDPNDEPASALLDRIRADRTTQGALFDGAPKRKRKS